MSQQEDPMQGAAGSLQSGQEHEAKDVRSGAVEQNEHPEILGNGQAGAVAEGQGKETSVREGMQPVGVTGPEGGENTTAYGTAKAEVADGDAQGGGRTIDTALSHHATPTKSKSSPVARKRPQTALGTSPSVQAQRSFSASQDLTGTRKASASTVPEPFRFSLDSRPRRSSDGALQTPPDVAPKAKLRSPSHTAPPVKDPKAASGRKVQTLQRPFNLEGLKRHEKALEHLKAEIAAKEAEESAPRSFRARPILKPEAATSTRVVAPPTKPSAFKLSVEDRAERRDKFKKQLEDREQELEGEKEKILQDLKNELDKEEKQSRRSASFRAAPAKITPDDKVFKPKLGQSPTTTPRAPRLGPQRRHSTGSQEGSAEGTPTSGARKTPGGSPGSSKVSSPLLSKPPSPRVSNSPSLLSSKPLSAGVSRQVSKNPSLGPATPPPRPSKPGPLRTPSPKPTPSTSKTLSPRPSKPAPSEFGAPGVVRTPASGQKRAPAPSASTPSSPRPMVTGGPKVSIRRSSDTGAVAGKPSPRRVPTTSSPVIGHATHSSAATQATRPLSASKASVSSARTPLVSSSKRPARPQSASAGKGTPSPSARKSSPRKALTARETSKATVKGNKQAREISEPAGVGATRETDAPLVKEVRTDAEVDSNLEEMASEPQPADIELEKTIVLDEKPQEEKSTGETVQPEQSTEIGEVGNQSSDAPEAEPKERHLAKLDANGIHLEAPGNGNGPDTGNVFVVHPGRHDES